MTAQTNTHTLPAGFSTVLSPDLTWSHFAEIDSTNSYLLETKQVTNHVASADSQTQGRGRHQQRWIGNARSALFSLSTPFPQGTDISAWPVQVALTLGETLNALLTQLNPSAARIHLKWPNDLFLQQRQQWAKCGGILIETSIGKKNKVVTGVGLNLSPIHQVVSDDYTAGFIDLPLTSKDLIAILSNRLYADWRAFCAAPSVSPSAYHALDYLFGKRITASDLRTDATQTGIAAGINASGHLLLQQSQKTLEITSQQRIRLSDY